MEELAATRDRVGEFIEHVRLTLGGGILGCCIADLMNPSIASQSIGALCGMYLASVLLHTFSAEGG